MDKRDDDVRRMLESFSGMNSFTGYVLKDGESIISFSIGFIKPYINGNEYYIDQFCVDPFYQGQGIGSSFMEQIKNDLGEKGIHVAMLCTEAGYPAYDFYVKNGFSELADTRFLAAEF
jgi:ribosomal protein S18 acetylase RimI-like enzyme